MLRLYLVKWVGQESAPADEVQPEGFHLAGRRPKFPTMVRLDQFDQANHRFGHGLRQRELTVSVALMDTRT